MEELCGGGKAVTENSREGADREDERNGGEVGGKWGEGFSSPPKQMLVALK